MAGSPPPLPFASAETIRIAILAFTFLYIVILMTLTLLDAIKDSYLAQPPISLSDRRFPSDFNHEKDLEIAEERDVAHDSKTRLDSVSFKSTLEEIGSPPLLVDITPDGEPAALIPELAINAASMLRKARQSSSSLAQLDGGPLPYSRKNTKLALITANHPGDRSTLIDPSTDVFGPSLAVASDSGLMMTVRKSASPDRESQIYHTPPHYPVSSTTNLARGKTPSPKIPVRSGSIKRLSPTRSLSPIKNAPPSIPLRSQSQSRADLGLDMLPLSRKSSLKHSIEQWRERGGGKLRRQDSARSSMEDF